MRSHMVVATLLLSSTIAMAQTPGPSSYTITVTPQDLAKIGDALAAMPYKDVAQLMMLLRQQAQEQQIRATASQTPEAPK